MSFYLRVREECALEDEVFEDGAETRMECNKCVCACGNWVCTALTCTGAATFAHTTNVTLFAWIDSTFLYPDHVYLR